MEKRRKNFRSINARSISLYILLKYKVSETCQEAIPYTSIAIAEVSEKFYPVRNCLNLNMKTKLRRVTKIYNYDFSQKKFPFPWNDFTKFAAKLVN